MEGESPALTSLLLSIAESDSSLKKGDKVAFQNFLIKGTNASDSSHLLHVKSGFAIIMTVNRSKHFSRC